MKKKSLLASGIVVLSLILVNVFLYKINSQSSYDKLTKKGNQIAMYIEGEDGEYTVSQDNKFPTEGYVLNTERSSCTNGGILSQNPDTKKIKVKVSNVDTCTLYFSIEKCPKSSLYNTTTLVNGLKIYDESATTYNECNASEMYTFSHDNLTTTTEYNEKTYTHSATQVADWSSEERKDYRYIGANPNNYVTFNDETWRIIGVFTVEREVEGSESTVKEQLIKIIRNESIGGIPWDDYTDGSRTNEWSTASLQELLNGAYLNTGGSFSYTYKSTSTEEGMTITIPKGLNETARGQIAKVKWYLGGSKTSQNLGYQDYYNFERGETRYNTSRSTYLIQNVGLIYPSDYIYTYANGVDDVCYTDGYNCKTSAGGNPANGWMKKMFGSNDIWALAPIASGSLLAFSVHSAGHVSSYNDNSTFAVRPTVYLASGIKLMNGDGSKDRPYQLGE